MRGLKLTKKGEILSLFNCTESHIKKVKKSFIKSWIKIVCKNFLFLWKCLQKTCSSKCKCLVYGLNAERTLFFLQVATTYWGFFLHYSFHKFLKKINFLICTFLTLCLKGWCHKIVDYFWGAWKVQPGPHMNRQKLFRFRKKSFENRVSA